MNNVLIIPTGIGAEIGGHAGDGNAVARLIASVSDNLITHPNVVNAADINEMTDNTLYVEGSILDRFLEGRTGLKKVKKNKILVAVNPEVPNEVINSVSAARATLGIDAEIIQLKFPLMMIATIVNEIATGDIHGYKELIKQVRPFNFDALAIVSPIIVPKEIKQAYFEGDIKINPWGGVEAKASRLIAEALDKPTAHAPIETDLMEEFNKVADPRKAAELVSISYLHCVLKGLHKAPRPHPYSHADLINDDIDCMITPGNVVGRPHIACMSQGIPIIAVMGNKTVLNNQMPLNFIKVETYLEAVGVIQAIKEGISLESVTRPISMTKVNL